MAPFTPSTSKHEWLDHVKPVGMVVSPNVLNDKALTPLRQSAEDSDKVAELLNEEGLLGDEPRVWDFMERILDWDSKLVVGSPNGPSKPNLPCIPIPEHDTALSPNWAIPNGSDDKPWDLLIKIEGEKVELDKRAQKEGWAATPQQQFERLLRESKALTGLLISDKEFRLIHAPIGETSGYISFPIQPLAEVSGRLMLGGLKLLLNNSRIFTAAEDQRLPALLEESRESQAAVSIELANQVLGAMYELLRGLDQADSELIRNLAKSKPIHLYKGLISVLMRLVVILYSEDRDLLPSSKEPIAIELYESSYSIRNLYARLVHDESLNPDTMDERKGSWGQLISLFRMVHDGCQLGTDDSLKFVQARGGKLFDPNEFPFLEGRRDKSDEVPRILNVSDGCVLRILENLMTLAMRGDERERISYRTLDVEQIGSVYEIIMGFTAEITTGQVLAIKAGKNNSVPVYLNLDELLSKTEKRSRIKYIKEVSGRGLTTTLGDAVEEANSVDELCTALDSIVDQRGSPRNMITETGIPILQPTNERRQTGSHYTPRVLTEPIVKHALEPIFERLGEDPTADQILELKVCDPAMGSGAFLVEATRALARKLVDAWNYYTDTRPEIPAEDDLEVHARRKIVQNCIYGVDRNPLAVDMAKLSLWLATLAEDKEFTFLDHALKCGDSLVGLTNEQFFSAHWDMGKEKQRIFTDIVEDEVNEALKLRDKLRKKLSDGSSLTTQELIEENEKVEKEISEVCEFGDAIIAAFFQNNSTSEREESRLDVIRWYTGIEKNIDKIKECAKIFREGHEHSFAPFHWEIEFPEVFRKNKLGFDVIVGNPPFAGRNTIINSNHPSYIPWLRDIHNNSGGNSDLVAHFFRRSFSLLKSDGVAGLIATNSVCEGDTRIGGLTQILSNGGSIFRAQTGYKWPGQATVTIVIVHLIKGKFKSPKLNGKEVSRISAFLVEGKLDNNPHLLSVNSGKSFKGTDLAGIGFTFDDIRAVKGECENIETMKKIIEQEPKSKEVIFPFIGGEEVLTSPTQQPHRFVINFSNIPLGRKSGLDSWYNYSEIKQGELIRSGIVPLDYPNEVAEDWPGPLEIIRKLVKPIRDKANRKANREKWWIHAETRPGLYNSIKKLDHVFVASQVATHLCFVRMPSNIVFSTRLVILANSNFSPFSLVQSRVHSIWVNYFSSTFGDAVCYTPSDSFQTFPFPKNYELSDVLERIGHTYHDHRAELMIQLDEGLTKTYNRFHDETQTSPDLVKLRDLHHEMDVAVLREYGWNDLADIAKPQFIPQKGAEKKALKTRLEWDADFKNKVFERLLALNEEFHQLEIAEGKVKSK